MKTRVLLAGAVVAGAISVIAATMGEASPKLKAFAEAMGSAQSFSASYTVTPIGSGQEAVEYKVALAKPNKARLETPDQITIADGTTVTVYTKADNSYYKKSQNDAELMGIFGSVDATLWRTFFKPGSVTNFAGSKDAGTKQLGGKTLNVVNVTADPKGEVTMRLYTDQADNMIRKGELNTPGQGGTVATSVLQVTECSMEANSDLFAFKAPSGAKEVDMSAVVAGVWLTDFNKALSAAKASNRLLVVDFMASWCGPCHMMDDEVFKSDKFKTTVAKDFILCKVDVDLQKDIAAKYGITAMPTVKFLKGDGSVVHEFVGYGGPDAVYSEFATAKSKMP
ncbi:MAG: thioredoxin family protein [Armatimonadetes bacterium]|nr:thioredoxin family protein [Armatimonadota bacterium]